MIYDVLVTSLARSHRATNKRWARGIWASSLADASRQAEAKYPNLGLTPTTTSMAWPVWPQPKGVSDSPACGAYGNDDSEPDS